MSKSNFENMVAGVEFLFPRYRGQLRWARAIIIGWGVMHVPKHTTPLCAGPAHLVAVHMAAMGHERLGAGLLIQQNLGLRPSELLAIEPQDVCLPQQAVLGVATSGAVVGLGLRTGTKAKRAQSVILRDPLLLLLLNWLVVSGRPGEPMVPYSYEQYRRILKRVVEVKLKMDIPFTPHSPRAGFASDATAAGKSFVTEIREGGRWIADSSLRTYVDIVTAAAISTSLRLEGYRPAILFARSNILEFFPSALPYLPNGGGASGDSSSAIGGREAGPSVEGRVGPETGWLPNPQGTQPEGDVASSRDEDCGQQQRSSAKPSSRGPGRGRGRGLR